jgi:hypothetical protein
VYDFDEGEEGGIALVSDTFITAWVSNSIYSLPILYRTMLYARSICLT